jgi:hypothetical protein
MHLHPGIAMSVIMHGTQLHLYKLTIPPFLVFAPRMTLPTAAEEIAMIPHPEYEPTLSHTRVGENRTKIWVSATMPLILHFLSTLTLIAVLIFYVNGNDFTLQSRSSLSNFTPRQSDITTAISSSIVICRLFAGVWASAMLWRCVFILMHKGGISLEQIHSLLTWHIHVAHREPSQGYGLLVTIILLAALPSQLSGPILTGSITWSSSHRFTKGPSMNITFFPDDAPLPLILDTGLDRYYSLGGKLAPSLASSTWKDSLADKWTMRRLLFNAPDLPINSTLNNVTLPYFSVTKLEWIKDPEFELPTSIIQSCLNNSDLNPLNDGYHATIFLLIPDVWGGAIIPTPYTGIISETRFVVARYGEPCNATPVDPSAPQPLYLPAKIGGITWDTTSTCLKFGRVTYVAGEAECKDCRVSALAIVQNDTALTVRPSKETLLAIAIMPIVMPIMNLQNNSLPNTGDVDWYVTQQLIRSYAASWTFFADAWMNMLSTDVQIPIPTSRANVLLWRAGLWLGLNLLFTLSGLLFLFTQRKSGQQLIGNPPLTALLLDTSQVLHERERAFCNFSTLTEGDEGIGYLHLTRNWAQGGHMYVENSSRTRLDRTTCGTPQGRLESGHDSL